MRIRLMSLALILALILASGPGYGFSIGRILGHDEGQNLDTFKLIHVGDLKSLMDNSGRKVYIYDANLKTTRAKFGVIPGATLLDSDDSYPLSLLPPSKGATLVFYCANIY